MTDRRLVLVVGANRGIGLGVVRAFLAADWDVVATARHPEQAGALNDLAGGMGDRVRILPVDMGDAAAVDGFVPSHLAPALGGRSAASPGRVLRGRAGVSLGEPWTWGSYVVRVRA